MNKDYFAVIMAGGGGTRLWPLSTIDHPKQMLEIINGRSLFQISVERLKNFFEMEQVFVVTVKDQVQDLSFQVQSLPNSNFIIEPMPRGTASVVGLAAIHLLKKNRNAVMAVLTADHVIKNIERFHDLLQKAFLLAQRDYLVTLGIEPTYAATGYGYIKAGSKLETPEAFWVERFIEKPEKDTADKFFRKGGYFWNSGMFIWRAERILSEFKKQMPWVYDKLIAIYDHLDTADADEFIHKIWPTVEKQTIDYGIMEKADEVVVLSGKDLQWRDIGSWDSIYDLLEPDDKGNIVKNSKEVLIDSENVLIFSDDPKKMIATIGLKDIVIVNCDKALLICKKGESQRVKDIIEKLKGNDQKEYL